MVRVNQTAARAALDALPGLTWHPFEREDLSAIAQFYKECEDADNNPEHTSLAHLQEFWDSPRSVPSEDTLVAYDDRGVVVATARAGCNRSVTKERRVFLGGAVHPSRRGEGIGAKVLTWQLAHGHDWDRASRKDGYGALLMSLYAPVDQADVRDLAERHGLEVERYFFEMERPLDDNARGPVSAPDGIRIADWDPARSTEAHTVVNTAFRDHWGHVDSTEQMWHEQVTSYSFRPTWALLAIEKSSDRVVGAAMNAAYEQDWSEGHRAGYTDDLGVLREFRGRGIASALLQESMRRFAADGMDAASLGVDSANPSGALRLYESLGYHRTASTCVHQLIRPVSATESGPTPERWPG